MSFEVKAGGVDVEEVMRAIRQSIAEKKARGLYTEEEIERIASHRLHPVLDPHELESRLLAELLAEPAAWNYTFDPEAIYRSSRGFVGRLLEWARRWLRPVQKLFWNPVPMISALSRQADLNRTLAHLLHNLVQETTRLNLESQDLRNRVLQLQGQLALQARRQKVLEALLEQKGALPEPPIKGT